MKVVVVDLEGLVFYDGWVGMVDLLVGCLSCIEGIGCFWVELLFVFIVIDEMIQVFDVGLIVVICLLCECILYWVGGLIGMNFYGVFQFIVWMCVVGEIGSVVILICDSGVCYVNIYYFDEWVVWQGWDFVLYCVWLECFFDFGVWID